MIGQTEEVVLPEPTLPEQIEAAHQAAIGAARSAIEHAIECGKLLLQAKAAVPHGQWLGWIESHLSFGPRQAQKYCRLAEHADQVLNANANSEVASIDDALAAMRCACDGGELDDKPQSAPAGTADLSARRELVQRRDEAIERLIARMHKVAERYGATAVAQAQNAYQVPELGEVRDAFAEMVQPPSAATKPPALATITPETVQPGLRAISLLEQALRLIEADGQFSPTIREHLSGLIDAVEAEWSDRPLQVERDPRSRIARDSLTSAQT
jgi:Protein of unknown function (DUF3102)